MAGLIEVLKDKEGRKPVIKFILICVFFAFTIFCIGFFSAFVYDSMFPEQTKHIQNLIGGKQQVKTPILPNKVTP